MDYEQLKKKASSATGNISFAQPDVNGLQTRIILRNCGKIDPESIDQYITVGGYSGLHKALQMTPVQVIDEISKFGLRGRGGAGFLTATKWLACAETTGTEKYFICNAHEGDPASLSGRFLIENDPHSVLEGILIGAYATGANSGYIYIRDDCNQAIERINIALQQMAEDGLTGENILGSSFSFRLSMFKAKSDFIDGEETILLRTIENKRKVASSRPPYPTVSGLFDKPTVINNVETLANVSAILQKDNQWFASLGSKLSKGTKLLTLTGPIKNPGIIEIPFGTTPAQIINEIGGGLLEGSTLKALEIGGPTGGILPVESLEIPVDYETLADTGATMCSGVLRIDDNHLCMVERALEISYFNTEASCGKCVLCREGMRQLYEILHDIVSGKGEPGNIDLLQELGEGMKLGSLCNFGKNAANPVLTTIKYFREEYETHIKDKRCPVKKT